MSRYDFQPMQPHPFGADMRTFTVYCARCAKPTNSTDVSCDVNGKAGDYYCQHCAALVDGNARRADGTE